MQRGRIIALGFMVFALANCNQQDERFLDTYTDILIIRMSESDSTAAQRKVAAALAQHGYSEADFRREFFDRAREPENLRVLIDSARARALRQVAAQK
ncbi:MAG: hypothetical protein KatS3mg039_1102 [Candidatus Kapaibacterium sp.]|nr:MAG: hypothetical protein KatS3mg039_1102 [Candidatus Kapabacteria bacterium]